MAGEAALALTSIMSLLELLKEFNEAIPYGAFLCPADPPPVLDDILRKKFDYIIVGGGTAGLVLANRLSACPRVNVLVLEAGGCPPFEAVVPRPIALQSRTKFDYNFTSVNDNRTCQSLQGQVASLTQGKMLGGSSSIFHMIVTRGAPPDYEYWVQATNDSSWSYENLLYYFKRSEDVRDKPILREYRSYHGINGPTIMQKQLRPENEVIFDAHEELGLPKLIDTSSRDSVLGIVDPLFQIGEKNRQSSLVSYWYPIRGRRNLIVITGATVNKILIVKKVATGVRFVYNKLTYTVNAKTEVIVSAGAFRTPQLLMLSGIGPAEHLTSKGIPVIVDLPVGQNLQDHVSGALAFNILNDTSPDPPFNPYRFAVPLTQSYYNENKTASYAENFGINLYFHRNSTDTMQFCLNLFLFSVPVCQIIYEANQLSAVELIATGLAHPMSRGEVKLNTTDINDQPLVYLKYLTVKSDLEKLGDFMKYLAGLADTPAFKKRGGTLIDFGICKQYTPTGDEYWQCVALTTSCTVWHYCGTASMGSVVDTKLRVKGIKKLRVVDASVIPYITGGNINAVVLAVAEKISDVILASNPACAATVKKNHCGKCQ